MRSPCSPAATQRPRQRCRLLAHGRYASIPNAGTRCPIISLRCIVWRKARTSSTSSTSTPITSTPLFVRHWGKTLTTLHGRLDLPDLPSMLREFAMMPLVSISNAQRMPVPWANWYGTVYHGLPSNLYAGGCGDGGYLAYIGRICPEKRPDWAIEIARRAGMPLMIAAKVDEVDRTYHETSIKPLLEDPRVDFVGEIGDSEKGAFLGDAAALLFPIDWPEPFGLALIEAMANGTPVIAFRCGSVPEIVEHGVTGSIVESVDEAVAAVPLARTLDRVAIRRRFGALFGRANGPRLFGALRCGASPGTAGAVKSSSAGARGGVKPDALFLSRP